MLSSQSENLLLLCREGRTGESECGAGSVRNLAMRRGHGCLERCSPRQSTTTVLTCVLILKMLPFLWSCLPVVFFVIYLQRSRCASATPTTVPILHLLSLGFLPTETFVIGFHRASSSCPCWKVSSYIQGSCDESSSLSFSQLAIKMLIEFC